MKTMAIEEEKRIQSAKQQSYFCWNSPLLLRGFVNTASKLELKIRTPGASCFFPNMLEKHFKAAYLLSTQGYWCHMSHRKCFKYERFLWLSPNSLGNRSKSIPCWRNAARTPPPTPSQPTSLDLKQLENKWHLSYSPTFCSKKKLHNTLSKSDICNITVRTRPSENQYKSSMLKIPWRNFLNYS